MKPFNLQSSKLAKAITLPLLAATVLVPALGSVQSAFAAPNFPDPAMQTVWNRTDKPVQDGVVARSWMWGPSIFYSAYEPYIEGVNGQHLVAYSDKSRMEINNPNGDKSNPFYVTNGLLVVEMMTGRIQTGNATFLQSLPADKPVAGDLNSNNAPTYASLANFASLNGDKRAANRTGQAVSEGLQRTGGVGTLNNLSGYAKYAVYESTLGHNIPDVFWNFMNQRGPVYVNGQYKQDTIIDWVFAMGYPVTEPYWIPIQVGNEQRWVLMQAFQRRILTYTPGNPQGFQVEMGNVGRTYYDWRYANNPPASTPTPQPTVPAGQPGITINPGQGDATTTIQVNGVNFPRNSQVVLQVERADANYSAGVATVGTNGNGAFTANFRLPAQATRYDSVNIAAIANSGSIKVTAHYRLTYNPQINISPKGAIINGSTMTVSGSGFPAGVNVQIGVLVEGQQNADYPGSSRTDGNGSFQASFNIGNRNPGARLIIFATAEGGVKATYTERVTVYNRPNLQVIPGSGPVGVNVTVQGSGWPAGEQISIGYRGSRDNSEAFVPNSVRVDNNGNFSTSVFLDNSLNGKGQIIFAATAGGSGIRIEATYTIVGSSPTPAPPPQMSVNPSAAQVGQNVTVNGSGWTPGSQVYILLLVAGAQQDVAQANVGGNGAFSTSFNLGSNWANRGVIQVRGTSNDGRSAATSLTVLPSGGTGNLEYGQDMTVQTYSGSGGPYVKVTGRGWQPGLNLTISVVSSGGDVNFGVANAVVKDDSSWQATFNNNGPWVGRSDIGVRAAENSGRYSAGRKLPVTNLVKVTGGTYTLSGSNWGPGSTVTSVLLVSGSEADGLGRTVVDGNGNFSFNITVPRADGPRSVRVVSSGGNGLFYQAVFGIDSNAGALQSNPNVDLDPAQAPDPIIEASVEADPLAGASRKAAPANPVIGMPNTGEGDQTLSWWAFTGGSAVIAIAGLLLLLRTRKTSM